MHIAPRRPPPVRDVIAEGRNERTIPTTSPSSGRLLTLPEAAAHLNVSVRWLQEAVQQRRVRCTRIGKHVRFTNEHLVELIAAGEQPVTLPAHPATAMIRQHGRRSRL
jgi:excisionase family DNA binding protein